MQADIVRFEGNGPFYLREVKRANAGYLDHTIQLTLHAVADEQGAVQIETQMTPRAAMELVERLLHALRSASAPAQALTRKEIPADAALLDADILFMQHAQDACAEASLIDPEVLFSQQTPVANSPCELKGSLDEPVQAPQRGSSQPAAGAFARKADQSASPRRAGGISGSTSAHAASMRLPWYRSLLPS